MLPPQRARKGLVLLGLAASCCNPTFAQTIAPLGGEYNPGGPLPGDQLEPAIAFGSQNGFLVWQDSGLDRNGTGIGALRLDGNQNAVGQPFQVNAQIRGDQAKPVVAMLTGGGAVVAWQSTIGSSNRIVARFLRADGTFATGDVMVDPSFNRVLRNYTTNLTGFRVNKLRDLRFRITEFVREIRERQHGPAVAALPDGGAVVAWSSGRRLLVNTRQVVTEVKTRGSRSFTNDMLRPLALEYNSGSEVFFQRFAADGTKAGPEVQANQSTERDQRNPSVATLPDGRFVIVWVSERFGPGMPGDPGEVQITARLFSATGEPAGDEFVVNPDPALCAAPAVSARADGQFTVIWNQWNFSNVLNSWDVYARTFSPDGTAQGGAARLNDYQRGRQFDPQVASAGTSQLMIWTSYGQDGYQEGIFGRTAADGAASLAELQINVDPISRQLHPAVGSDGARRLVAVWTSFTEEGSFDLRARRYNLTETTGGSLVPASATADAAATSGQVVLRPTLLDARAGRLQLSWSGVSGSKYQLQVSTNLMSWADVGSPRTATGPADFVSIDTQLPAAFYRLVRVP